MNDVTTGNKQIVSIKRGKLEFINRANVLTIQRGFSLPTRRLRIIGKNAMKGIRDDRDK
jgi:hypothetical protein